MEPRENESMESTSMPQPERLLRREQAQPRHEQGEEPETQSAQAQSKDTQSIGQTLRVIEMLEHKISDAYRMPLKRDTCLVSASEMADLFGQLRIVLPKSVVEASSVLEQRTKIIDDAKAMADKTANEADRIYNDTVSKAKKFKEEVEADADAYDKTTRAKVQEDAQAIIDDAQARADQIILAAQQQAQNLIDENEITRRAQAYAMETRENAEKDADSIYNQACVHTDKLLSGAAAALSRSAQELAQLRDNLLGGQTDGRQ